MGESWVSGSRSGLPHRFQPVGEALISGSDILAACAVAGQDLARDGASVGETLEGLRATWQAVSGTDPSFEVVDALVNAWSETTLGYLHQLSCDDPLTGLSSQAHLRSRLSELYRLEESAGAIAGHALVLCAMPFGDDPSEEPGDHFTRAMRLARAGELARTAFARDETIARLGTHRVAVLARRDDRLGRRVRVLRTLLESLESGPGAEGPPPRLWIEGLPNSDRGAGMLLDELARG
ncbi:hypothetical protein [Nocardioides sp.]|uniref:hypothetical protein n=1 Tax=Nocardioides sp. TaxID=35761 RepID=UPI00263237B4|nr:hypothetical protein [Nocardioides sp.]MCW2737378.1 hypothetical protein [Nocardioides sp.]